MEKSAFWTTNGTGDGASGGYTATEFYDFIRRLLITDQEATQGVLRGVLNELAVTGSSSPLSLASGCAIVHGLYYENSAALNLTVTTPVVGTTGGRVNLKVDWTAQTVRAVVQLNTDGTATIPSLVQTAGSEWNLPLYTFTVTTAGVITLTDVRSFCQFANYLTATAFDEVAGLSVIGRSANTTGQSAAITAGTDAYVLRRSGTSIGFGQVATGGIADDAVTNAKIADDAVDTDQLATGAVGADALDSDAVDDTKVGNRVPQFYRRQGGSDTDWISPGTTTRTPGNVMIQAGVINGDMAAGTFFDNISVYFPVSFSGKPIVFLTLLSPSSNQMFWISVFGNGTWIDQIDFIRVKRPIYSTAVTYSVQWLAIGPV